MTEQARRIERVIRGVVAAAVRAADAGGVVVLDDWTAEGELLYEWLVRELSEARVWRVASLASNVQGTLGAAEAVAVGAWRGVQDHAALIAHPINRTALLLGGAPPRADLLPFGDLYASQMETLAGGWTVPPPLTHLVGAAGGVRALDTALARWVDDRYDAAAALAGLDGDVARQVIDAYERGRYFRLRPRLVPKLGQRTLGIDLFD